LSWDGAQVGQIAAQLGCHPRTVYRWLHRFNAGGIGDLGDLPRSGRPRRLSELERGRIIALVGSNPPGRLVRQPDGTLAAADEQQPAPWTLDALAAAAQAAGIQAGRSQVRRILQAEGVRWRTVRSWSTSGDADFAPKSGDHRPLHHPAAADHRDLRRRARPGHPRSFPPPPGWSTDGHRSKAPLESGRGSEKTWGYGALRPGDGQAVTLTAPSRNSAGYQQLLAAVEQANPTGEIAVITDNLSSHSSFSTRTWLASHSRIRQVFIPVGRAGATCRRPGGAASAASPSLASASPVLQRSPSPPGWRPVSSTRALALGVGPPPTVSTLSAPRLTYRI
jgi:transposase